ncbi:E3 ubiquitin-protein ligase MARCHF6-like [Lampetra fluviatilis]
MEALTDDGDICRVCRSEGTAEKPLYHPCVCTGSIKYIHQDCLLQWLKHSKKEYCELCKHRFAFTPIYSPDMPSRLPLRDILAGLFRSVCTGVRFWLHYTLVAFAWLGVVPLTACRIYKCLFTGSVSSLLTLPLDLLSTDNLLADCFQGCFVVTCTLCAFISLVWLREQILHGGAPPWLEQNQQARNANPDANPNANLDVNPNANDNGPGQPAPHDAQAEEVVDLGAPPARDGAEDGEPAGGGAAEGAGPQDRVVPPVVAEPAGDGAPGPRDVEEGPQEEEEEEVEGELEEEVEVGDGEEEENVEDEAAADGVDGAAQGGNWNALEWDRAAEELTWERMLGLDGSLVFLEHVFWVVSLNTLFILVFAFCPYHVGHFSVVAMGVKEHVAASHFEGLITTIVGYVLLALALVLFHALASLVRFQRSKRILGLGYVVVKVSLLVVVEIGVFPLICGWWLDICSLEMFDATLKDREASFQSAPGTTMFLHWLVGMVYVFYFAAFILLLREVLRPGLLWFLRNLNDPDFNPVQEMIHLPIYRHVRRFILSVIVFGSIVLLMLWMPIHIIKSLLPTFLPYNVMLYSDAPVSELSLELLLLQVVLPALLEQGHTRQWLKGLVRAWTLAAGRLLDLRSYLLGDEAEGDTATEPHAGADHQPGPNNNNNAAELEEGVAAAPPMPAPAAAPAAAPALGGLNMAHQAMLQQGGPVGFQPYHRPSHFASRVMMLLALLCFTLMVASLVCLIVPVLAGRWLMSFWTGETRIHELYTAACGLYVCWVAARAITISAAWLPQGRTVLLQKVKEWSLLLIKSVVVAVLMAGVVPLLLGILFDLVVVAPLRVPLDQTPIFFPWQNWALGVLHAKIITAITLMGPQWWLKSIIEQIYANGLRNMNLWFIIRELAAPVVTVLLLYLCIPYVIAAGAVPLLGAAPEMQTLVRRRIYPLVLMVVMLLGFVSFQAQQFRRLYEHIKNDKYLVGQQLVNYEQKSAAARSAQAAASAVPPPPPL